MNHLRRWSARGLTVLLLWGCVAAWANAADEEKKADAPAAVEPAKSDSAMPVALPDWYTGTNPEKGDAKWPDPTGASAAGWATPSAKPIGDGDPAALKSEDLYSRIVHNLFSINMVWTLITGFLVMFMQAGFMLVEVGLCRAKNAAHTAAMNLMIYPLGCIAFWAYGFGIGWGNWYNGPVAPGWYSSLGPGTSILNQGLGINPNYKKDEAGKELLDEKGQKIPDGTYEYGLIGTKGFFLKDCDDVSVMCLFFFMMVFMDTTATIPTGAMAERWAWKNFVLYGLWVALPYCIFANWVWGGGWLAQMGINWKLGHGAVDFAGSGVVHAMGGIISLVGAKLIGPRIGKFGADGKPKPIPAHHVPMVVAGTFILCFGWFGFNPGSTLSGTDLRISVVVVNTMLAGVAGALASMFTMNAKGLKPDPTMMCNGMLAGLVAITAPCAFVDSWAAVLIGAIAGILVVLSVFFWENRGIDDPVGAISVHGVNGVWGIISVGLFANGKYGAGWGNVNRELFGGKPDAVVDGVRGWFFGDISQLWAQLINAGTVIVFGAIMAYVWFKVSNAITPLRVSEETEIGGLDVPEMGAEGYPDFSVAKLS